MRKWLSLACWLSWYLTYLGIHCHESTTHWQIIFLRWRTRLARNTISSNLHLHYHLDNGSTRACKGRRKLKLVTQINCDAQTSKIGDSMLVSAKYLRPIFAVLYVWKSDCGPELSGGWRENSHDPTSNPRTKKGEFWVLMYESRFPPTDILVRISFGHIMRRQLPDQVSYVPT